jgi:hypothetical protein
VYSAFLERTVSRKVGGIYAKAVLNSSEKQSSYVLIYSLHFTDGSGFFGNSW